MLRISLVLLFVGFGHFVFAQKAEVEEKVQATSLHPGYTKKKYYAPKHVKASIYKKPKVTHTAQYEFYERVEKAAKQKQKLLKKLTKPQYSDFSYFGHKHKPKKRKPHKMKYCKECGIRH